MEIRGNPSLRIEKRLEPFRRRSASNSFVAEKSEEVRKGDMLLVSKRYEDAAKHFDLVLASDPMNLDALTGEAEALYGLGKNREAMALHKKAIDVLDSGKAIGSAMKKGADSLTDSVLRKINHKEITQLALYRDESHVPRGREIAMKLLYSASSPDISDQNAKNALIALVSLVYNSHGEENWKFILGVGESVNALNKDSVTLALERLMLFEKKRTISERGFKRKGSVEKEKQAKAPPYDEGVTQWISQGNHALILGHDEKAEESFEKVLKKAPHNFNALVGKAQALRALGRVKEAKPLYMQAIEVLASGGVVDEEKITVVKGILADIGASKTMSEEFGHSISLPQTDVLVLLRERKFFSGLNQKALVNYKLGVAGGLAKLEPERAGLLLDFVKETVLSDKYKSSNFFFLAEGLAKIELSLVKKLLDCGLLEETVGSRSSALLFMNTVSPGLCRISPELAHYLIDSGLIKRAITSPAETENFSLLVKGLSQVSFFDKTGRLKIRNEFAAYEHAARISDEDGLVDAAKLDSALRNNLACMAINQIPNKYHMGFGGKEFGFKTSTAAFDFAEFLSSELALPSGEYEIKVGQGSIAVSARDVIILEALIEKKLGALHSPHSRFKEFFDEVSSETAAKSKKSANAFMVKDYSGKPRYYIFLGNKVVAPEPRAYARNIRRRMRTAGAPGASKTDSQLIQSQLFLINMRKGLHELSVRNFTIAEERFDSALLLRQNNSNALLGRGLSRLRSGRVKEALQDFNTVLGTANDDVDAWVGKGEALGLKEESVNIDRRIPERIESFLRKDNHYESYVISYLREQIESFLSRRNISSATSHDVEEIAKAILEAQSDRKAVKEVRVSDLDLSVKLRGDLGFKAVTGKALAGIGFELPLVKDNIDKPLTGPEKRIERIGDEPVFREISSSLEAHNASELLIELIESLKMREYVEVGDVRKLTEVLASPRWGLSFKSDGDNGFAVFWGMDKLIAFEKGGFFVDNDIKGMAVSVLDDSAIRLRTAVGSYLITRVVGAGKRQISIQALDAEQKMDVMGLISMLRSEVEGMATHGKRNILVHDFENYIAPALSGMAVADESGRLVLRKEYGRTFLSKALCDSDGLIAPKKIWGILSKGNELEMLKIINSLDYELFRKLVEANKITSLGVDNHKLSCFKDLLAGLVSTGSNSSAIGIGFLKGMLFDSYQIRMFRDYISVGLSSLRQEDLRHIDTEKLEDLLLNEGAAKKFAANPLSCVDLFGRSVDEVKNNVGRGAANMEKNLEVLVKQVLGETNKKALYKLYLQLEGKVGNLRRREGLSELVMTVDFFSMLRNIHDAEGRIKQPVVDLIRKEYNSQKDSAAAERSLSSAIDALVAGGYAEEDMGKVASSIRKPKPGLFTANAIEWSSLVFDQAELVGLRFGRYSHGRDIVFVHEARFDGVVYITNEALGYLKEMGACRIESGGLVKRDKKDHLKHVHDLHSSKANISISAKLLESGKNSVYGPTIIYYDGNQKALSALGGCVAGEGTAPVDFDRFSMILKIALRQDGYGKKAREFLPEQFKKGPEAFVKGIVLAEKTLRQEDIAKLRETVVDSVIIGLDMHNHPGMTLAEVLKSVDLSVGSHKELNEILGIEDENQISQPLNMRLMRQEEDAFDFDAEVKRIIQSNHLSEDDARLLEKYLRTIKVIVRKSGSRDVAERYLGYLQKHIEKMKTQANSALDMKRSSISIEALSGLDLIQNPIEKAMPLLKGMFIEFGNEVGVGFRCATVGFEKGEAAKTVFYSGRRKPEIIMNLSEGAIAVLMALPHEFDRIMRRELQEIPGKDKKTLGEECELAATVVDGFLALVVRDLAFKIQPIDEVAADELIRCANSRLGKFNIVFAKDLDIEKLSLEDLSSAAKVPSVSSTRLVAAYHRFVDNLSGELAEKPLTKDNLTPRFYSSVLNAVKGDIRLRRNWLEDIKENELSKQRLRSISAKSKLTDADAKELLYSLVGRHRQTAVNNIKDCLTREHGLWNSGILHDALMGIHELHLGFGDTVYDTILSELARANITPLENRLSTTETRERDEGVWKPDFRSARDTEINKLVKATEIDSEIYNLLVSCDEHRGVYLDKKPHLDKAKEYKRLLLEFEKSLLELGAISKQEYDHITGIQKRLYSYYLNHTKSNEDYRYKKVFGRMGGIPHPEDLLESKGGVGLHPHAINWEKIDAEMSELDSRDIGVSFQIIWSLLHQMLLTDTTLFGRIGEHKNVPIESMRYLGKQYDAKIEVVGARDKRVESLIGALPPIHVSLIYNDGKGRIYLNIGNHAKDSAEEDQQFLGHVGFVKLDYNIDLVEFRFYVNDLEHLARMRERLIDCGFDAGNARINGYCLKGEGSISQIAEILSVTLAEDYSVQLKAWGADKMKEHIAQLEKKALAGSLRAGFELELVASDLFASARDISETASLFYIKHLSLLAKKGDLESFARLESLSSKPDAIVSTAAASALASFTGKQPVSLFADEAGFIKELSKASNRFAHEEPGYLLLDVTVEIEADVEQVYKVSEKPGARIDNLKSLDIDRRKFSALLKGTRHLLSKKDLRGRSFLAIVPHLFEVLESELAREHIPAQELSKYYAALIYEFFRHSTYHVEVRVVKLEEGDLHYYVVVRDSSHKKLLFDAAASRVRDESFAGFYEKKRKESYLVQGSMHAHEDIVIAAEQGVKNQARKLDMAWGSLSTGGFNSGVGVFEAIADIISIDEVGAVGIDFTGLDQVKVNDIYKGMFLPEYKKIPNGLGKRELDVLKNLRIRYFEGYPHGWHYGSGQSDAGLSFKPIRLDALGRARIQEHARERIKRDLTAEEMMKIEYVMSLYTLFYGFTEIVNRALVNDAGPRVDGGQYISRLDGFSEGVAMVTSMNLLRSFIPTLKGVSPADLEKIVYAQKLFGLNEIDSEHIAQRNAVERLMPDEDFSSGFVAKLTAMVTEEIIVPKGTFSRFESIGELLKARKAFDRSAKTAYDYRAYVYRLLFTFNVSLEKGLIEGLVLSELRGMSSLDNNRFGGVVSEFYKLVTG